MVFLTKRKIPKFILTSLSSFLFPFNKAKQKAGEGVAAGQQGLAQAQSGYHSQKQQNEYAKMMPSIGGRRKRSRRRKSRKKRRKSRRKRRKSRKKRKTRRKRR